MTVSWKQNLEAAVPSESLKIDSSSNLSRLNISVKQPNLHCRSGKDVRSKTLTLAQSTRPHSTTSAQIMPCHASSCRIISFHTTKLVCDGKAKKHGHGNLQSQGEKNLDSMDGVLFCTCLHQHWTQITKSCMSFFPSTSLPTHKQLPPAMSSCPCCNR
jgi:hypothetical protein